MSASLHWLTTIFTAFGSTYLIFKTQHKYTNKIWWNYILSFILSTLSRCPLVSWFAHSMGTTEAQLWVYLPTYHGAGDLVPCLCCDGWPQELHCVSVLSCKTTEEGRYSGSKGFTSNESIILPLSLKLKCVVSGVSLLIILLKLTH